MSLLADLLSKTKNIEPPGGKDVPPTLARAQQAGAMAPRLKRRFTIMSAIALLAIMGGILLPAQLKRLSAFLPDKTAATSRQPMKAPLPPRVSSADAPEKMMEDSRKALAGVQPDTAAVPADVTGAVPAKAPEPTRSVQTAKPAATGSGSKKQPTAAVKGKKIAAPPIAKASTPPRKKETQPQKKGIPDRHETAAPKHTASPAAKPDTNARGALLYAARSSEQAGDWRGALASYRAALEIDPENYRIMNNSAAAYNKLGMFPEGERAARMALSRKPDYVPALVNAAIACSSQGNNRDALKFFNAASAAEPGNRSLAVNLGIMQERAGNLDEAIAAYRRAALSGDQQALLGLGRVYEQKGNKGEAIAAYRLILSQRDVNPSLKQEVKGRLLRLEE